MAEEDAKLPEATPEPEPTDDEPTEGERRAQKDRARRLALKEDNDDLRAKLAEFEARDTKAEEAKLREQGDFDKIAEGLRTQIRDKDEKLEAALAKNAASEEGGRRLKFLDAIIEAGGIKNRAVANAMLTTIDLEGGTAPEHFTDGDARKAAKKLKKLAPEIFGSGSGEPKPPPGSGKPLPEPGSKEALLAKARAISGPGLSPEYLAATGQK